MNREIIAIKEEHSFIGEKIVIGFLRSKGLRVQRSRVPDSIHTVDPFNFINRWLQKNPRWICSVTGPNSLWDNDGLHKLIHWGIVIHASIDVFSRMIRSLLCATNNYADTCLTGFLSGVKKHGFPARVRGNNGEENNSILKYMQQKQGYKGAYIQGPSVHNQRMERLHYDTTHCVLSHFIDIFLFMEEHELLDRANKIDIYAVQFVFVPRIQNSLNEFKEGWKNHQLSAEQSKSPYRIWMLGMIDSNKEKERGVRMYLESAFNSNEFFGVDLSPSLGIMPSNSFVEVLDVSFDSDTDAIQTILNGEFEPLTNDGNFGI